MEKTLVVEVVSERKFVQKNLKSGNKLTFTSNHYSPWQPFGSMLKITSEPTDLSRNWPWPWLAFKHEDVQGPVSGSVRKITLGIIRKEIQHISACLLLCYTIEYVWHSVKTNSNLISRFPASPMVSVWLTHGLCLTRFHISLLPLVRTRNSSKSQWCGRFGSRWRPSGPTSCRTKHWGQASVNSYLLLNGYGRLWPLAKGWKSLQGRPTADWLTGAWLAGVCKNEASIQSGWS